MATRRILIADDEIHLTHIVAHQLGKTGAEVVVACNGAELLAMAGDCTPDLIVTDFQMPIVDGYQASVRLRENVLTRGIPIIMLTARGHRLSQAELSKTNIKLLVPKPFSCRDLVAQIDKLLSAGPVDLNTLPPAISRAIAA